MDKRNNNGDDDRPLVAGLLADLQDAAGQPAGASWCDPPARPLQPDDLAASFRATWDSMRALVVEHAQSQVHPMVVAAGLALYAAGAVEHPEARLDDAARAAAAVVSDLLVRQ